MSILLLAMVCLAGITLAIAQPATHDIYIDTNYMGTYNTGIRIDNATTEEIELNPPLIINETYFIKFRVVNNGTGPEDVNITVKVSNKTEWSDEPRNYSQNITTTHVGNVTWDTTGFASGNYTVTVNTSIPVDEDWSNNEVTRDVVLEMSPTPTPTTTPSFPVPFIISGYVAYPNNGTPVLNPKVTITNLNTSENFMVKTYEAWNYYRMQTDSTHVHADNAIRINAKENHAVRLHNITEADIENGGFRQDLPEPPDLTVANFSREWVDFENKTYNITYTVENIGGIIANKSITAIEINEGVKETDFVPALAPGANYTSTVGTFNFTSLVIRVCADYKDTVKEMNETNNCMKKEFPMPDLIIVNHSEEWVNRANRTFNVTYMVKNTGNANASSSMTYVHVKDDHGKYDRVPALEPGESYANTLGPFHILPDRYRTEVEICADYNKTVWEGSDGEDNNCNDPEDPKDMFGLPKLEFWGERYGDVDFELNWEKKTYNISYSILNDCNLYLKNAGAAKSNTSEVHIYIDGEFRENGTVPPLEPWFSKGQSGADDYTYKNTSGPFSMTGKNDTVRVCIEWFDGYEEECSDLVIGPGCVGNKTVFYCGQPITESCRLVTDMYATKPDFSKSYPPDPHGLLVGADDITIDGNGFAIIGDRCTTRIKDDSFGEWVRWAGISNSGHKNVTIKNLEVRDFCNGISIANTDNNIIENCSVHDNGADDTDDMYTYGITVASSDHVTINNCSIYNNTGILTDENVAGGHGINFDEGSDYCEVTNSHIFNNYLSGILASPTCKYLYIANNTVEENGYCNESGFCAGVNLHWKGGFGLTTNSTVENNTILNNTGSGIYVTHGYTSIKNNTVKGSKNGKNVSGNGIRIHDGKVTFLYNNTCCDNEGMDIVNRGSATFGDDNTCDTTDNYNDEGTRGCNFYCDGENGVCVGDVTGTVFKCGGVVTESCKFDRSMSCRGCATGYGLIAGKDNITINGTGYALTGNFSGIGIFSNHSGVKIKNLQVEDFSTGMKIENTSENFVEDCTVRTNLLTGINFSADNGTVRNSRIYDNVGPGILVGGANSTFENNTVARNRNGFLFGYGIYISPDAENNTLITNAVGDNEALDIYNADGASNYNISDNNTCDTTYHYWDASMLKDKKYNCTYPWTMPDLVISNKSEHWVDSDAKTYQIKYTIENRGEPKSRKAGSSVTNLSIDRNEIECADNRVPSLNASESLTKIFNYIARMSGQSDEIKVCADSDNEVRENNEANIFYYKDNEWYSVEELFEDKEKNNCRKNRFSEYGEGDFSLPEVTNSNAACIARRSGRIIAVYRCSDTVEYDCTLNDSMGCPAGTPGLRVGANDITINGNGYAIVGNTTPADCKWAGEENPCTVSGIYNYGKDGVMIKNLKVAGFCNGIALKGTSGSPVRGNTIENCNIFLNGFDTPSGGSEMVTHGIHMAWVKGTTIKDNDIYHNRGTGASCGDGGNGIFLYAGSETNINNVITRNKLHENAKSGFWTKMGLHNAEITNNEVGGNGYGWGITDEQRGGIVLRCVNSDENNIKKNTVYENNGDGIYIGGGRNTMSNNEVNDNTEDGIDIERNGESNYLSNNNVCGNGVDIRVCEDCPDNTGPDNCCNETENYADEGKDEGCTWHCPCGEKPDLTITDLSAKWIDEGAKTYKIEYTIANAGNGEASESTTNIYKNDVFDRGDNVPALGINKSNKSEVKPFTLWGEVDKITVSADGEDKIKERNEDNNRMMYYFPPHLDSIVISPKFANLSVGDTQIFTATAYDQNEPPKPMGKGILISWSRSPEAVGDVAPISTQTDLEGNATTVFTAKTIGRTEIWAKNESVNDFAIVRVKPEDIEPLKEPSWRSGGGGRPPEGEENITGYEPGPGGGTGPFGADIGGEELPVNESETVSGGKTRKSGHPFGMGGEIIENVKVVAPVFLIIMVIIVIALFYTGYFGEKRAHRRNNRKEK